MPQETMMQPRDPLQMALEPWHLGHRRAEDHNGMHGALTAGTLSERRKAAQRGLCGPHHRRFAAWVPVVEA